MANPPETFQVTAAQLAWALGISPRAVQYQLKGVPPVPGRGAHRWAFVQLPESMRQQLHEAARAGDYRDAHALLSCPVARESLALAFGDARECDQRRAVSLHRALAASIARRNDASLGADEFNRMGAEDFRRVMGREISERHFRRLFDRVMERDGGAEQFDNLSLYLDADARPSVFPAAGTGNSGGGSDFKDLLALIAGFKNPSAPDREQVQLLWDAAFLRLADEGDSIKGALLAFLAKSAPFLSRNATALQRNFNRLFQRWKEGQGGLPALDDLRSGRPRGPELSDDTFGLLVAYAAKYGGGCDQAWREVERMGKIPEQILAYYGKRCRRMPRKYREQIVESAKEGKRRLHGLRHTKLTGPYINRNPNHPDNPLLAGAWDQSDDMTGVNIMWDRNEDGSFWLGQGQFLGWIDERSWLLYNWILIREKNYNAFHIRNSWTRKCESFGLPLDGLYLEGSFWQSARVWVGRRNEVPWSKAEEGIRRLGVRMQQSHYPRSKVIERVYGTLQNYFQTEPGYVGRNPLTDRYEGVQKQIQLVRSGQAHPSEFFYSTTEWNQRLAEWCHLYNHTPKYGKYHEGLAPAQVYEKLCPVERIVHIPAECRHLLASNKLEETIGPNGLSFRYGKRTFTYKSEELGRMRLKDPRCIVWFNPEDPTLCGVTDRDGENPIVVRIETDVPCHDASPELMARANAEIAAFDRPSRELYRTLKPIFTAEFEQRRVRPVISDGLAADTGRAFRAQGEVIKEEEKIVSRRRKRATKLGLNVAPGDPRFSQRVDAATELTDWLAKQEKKGDGHE